MFDFTIYWTERIVFVHVFLGLDPAEPQRLSPHALL